MKADIKIKNDARKKTNKKYINNVKAHTHNLLLILGITLQFSFNIALIIISLQVKLNSSFCLNPYYESKDK